jgi:hypothetical protein
MKRMFLVLLALGLFMAGCGTTSGVGGTSGVVGDPASLAKKLAADIGAVKERGSITIDGGTVWLKGEAYLKNRLTVLAGVTLDLTAKGAKFELQNGAKLTVDGTVIASGHGDQGKGWLKAGSALATARRSSTGAEPSASRARDACSTSVTRSISPLTALRWLELKTMTAHWYKWVEAAR